jgi:two-component system, sensor histidine kinase
MLGQAGAVMAKRKAKTRAKTRAKSSKPKAALRRRSNAHPAVRRETSDRGARAIELALAAFAHDVRTPLTGILAIGELLATSDLDERERRWVATLRSTAEHLASLTSLVVDAARNEAKGLVLRAELFDPRRLTESAATLFAARATAKGLQATSVIADDLPARVRGDPLRLRVVLENLLDNAVKFTEHGAVALKVEAAATARDRHKLTFSVSDSGIGISAAEIKHLFKPFAQANASVAQRFGGAGLGLVFVKQLARAMGGDLTVESKAGQGTTFALTIVVADAGNEVGSGEQWDLAQSEGLTRAGQSLRILCVEDNPYGRVVMNTILTQLGHEIDFLGTGDAAVDAVARGVYDLVFMDVKLAGLDGLEATRRIRALSGSAGGVPIIGISGHTGLTDFATARAAGMDAFLSKPVSPNMLAEAIRKVTSR